MIFDTFICIIQYISNISLVPEFSEFAATKLKYLLTSQLHIPKKSEHLK